MKRNYCLIIALALGLPLLTGCSLVEAPKGHVKEFVIQKGAALPVAEHKHVVNLEVVSDVPSDRPYIQIATHQRESLSGVQWHEPLDKMLSKVITHNLQDAGLTVYQGAATTSCDYHIKISVRHFGLEYHPGQKMLHVAYFVEIRDQPRGAVLRQKLFAVEQEHLWCNDAHYVVALNEAHDELIKKIYAWMSK